MSLVTDCKPDPERHAVIRECMETYGMDAPLGAPSGGEWPWNVISTRAVAYSCGMIARAGDIVEHRHDPDELALCRRLSDEAMTIMEGIEVGMGSEAGEPFRPFFIAANAGAAVPEEVTEKGVRRAFGGTLYPAAGIGVEPLVEAGRWWEQVVADSAEADDPDEYLAPWRALVRWFGGRSDLHAPAFVIIGESPLDDENGGCVFPRLAVAVTRAGSLVGIGGYVVHT